jgi:RNA polymerase sigma-70 factor (ECF subfamily)
MIRDIDQKKPKSDRIAFEQAALPLMEYLYFKALKLTKNQNDAEDLVQDTYTLGLRKFHMYTPDTNLKAWLSRLQFNLYISQYRRKRNRPDGASIAGMEEIARDRDHVEHGEELMAMRPEAVVESDYFSENVPAEIRDGLREMDSRYRDVLLMNVVGEKSYKDIAESLKVPVGTVMSRLSRAKAFLRQYFADVEPSAT